MDNDGYEIRRRLIELAMLAATVWSILPSHQRQQVMMRLARGWATANQRIATYIGRLAISDELAGRQPWGYRVAYDIMTGPYQHAVELYERMRNTPS